MLGVPLGGVIGLEIPGEGRAERNEELRRGLHLDVDAIALFEGGPTALGVGSGDLADVGFAGGHGWCLGVRGTMI